MMKNISSSSSSFNGPFHGALERIPVKTPGWPPPLQITLEVSQAYHSETPVVSIQHILIHTQHFRMLPHTCFQVSIGSILGFLLTISISCSQNRIFRAGVYRRTEDIRIIVNFSLTE